MNAPAQNLPAQRQQRDLAPIEVLKSTVARKADDFKMVLPSHITVDKFQRTIATAALSNPTLMTCDKQSLLIAAMKLAQDGLLPDGREAALVPFKTWNKETRSTIWQVQAMPMAWGLRKKILQSGQVVSLETGVVYRAEMESGNFIYEIGLDPPIRHRPKLDLTEEECADSEIVAAYSIARLKNEGGDPYWSVEVMRRTEIDKVRQTSQTGALGRTVQGGNDKGKPIPPKGPWVDWYGEMARKTVLRRHSKVLPMSGDLLDTLERDDAEEARAVGAAHLLETEERQPLTLPSAEDLAGGNEVIDEETGEVTRTDSRGMTEVDEDTARQLDGQTMGEHLGDEIPDFDKRNAAQSANDGTLSNENPAAAEGPADEQRGEERRPEADYYGAKPDGAAAGQTWWDGEKLRHAHGTANGIKWYLQPQQAETSAEEQKQQQQDDAPPYAAKVAELREAIDSSGTKAALKKAEDEYLRHCVGFPKEIGDELDAKIMAKRRELRAAEG